jgi:hypothetical protein
MTAAAQTPVATAAPAPAAAAPGDPAGQPDPAGPPAGPGFASRLLDVAGIISAGVVVVVVIDILSDGRLLSRRLARWQARHDTEELADDQP